MPAPASSNGSRQTEATAQLAVTLQVKYLLALPSDYAEAGTEPWPLVVFLHGSGERGEKTEVLRQFGPAAQIEQGRDFPFILLTPLCPEYEWWNLGAVEALIADLRRRYRVDPDRIYLTGLSMGGFGAWALAARHPDRYAAIVPICGGGEVDWAPRLARLPIWAFHGVLDPVVPVLRSQEMIDAIRLAGGEPRLTLYPEVHHDAWSPAYADETLYTWLLAQRRKR